MAGTPGIDASSNKPTNPASGPAPAPARAANEYTGFATCCLSWGRGSLALVGNGVNDFRCFPAPGVLEPPCWSPTQDPSRRQCSLVDDAHTCYSGGWPAAAAAARCGGVGDAGTSIGAAAAVSTSP